MLCDQGGFTTFPEDRKPEFISAEKSFYIFDEIVIARVSSTYFISYWFLRSSVVFFFQVLGFTSNCPNCQTPTTTNMKVVRILLKLADLNTC